MLGISSFIAVQRTARPFSMMRALMFCFNCNCCFFVQWFSLLLLDTVAGGRRLRHSQRQRRRRQRCVFVFYLSDPWSKWRVCARAHSEKKYPNDEHEQPSAMAFNEMDFSSTEFSHHNTWVDRDVTTDALRMQLATCCLRSNCGHFTAWSGHRSAKLDRLQNKNDRKKAAGDLSWNRDGFATHFFLSFLSFLIFIDFADAISISRDVRSHCFHFHN